jgi:hypothetical protein
MVEADLELKGAKEKKHDDFTEYVDKYVSGW